MYIDIYIKLHMQDMCGAHDEVLLKTEFQGSAKHN